MPYFDKTREDFKKKYYRKPVTILWSGGLDSNCILLMAIEAECEIHVVTVDSEQLPNYRAERQNRTAILDKLRDEYPRTHIRHEVILSQNMTGDFHFNQMQMWLSAMILLSTYGDLMIGYVCGDEAISYLPELQKAWKACSFNRKDPMDLHFPLTKVTKAEFTDYVAHTLPFMSIYCEQPIPTGDMYSKCGNCPSCRRMTDDNVSMVDTKSPNHAMRTFIENNSKYEWAINGDGDFVPNPSSVTEDLLMTLDVDDAVKAAD